MTPEESKSGTGWWIAGTAAIAYILLSIIDLPNFSFGGFLAPQNRVSSITPGSPAETAGFEVGDQILIYGGVDADDARTLSRRPRPQIGETRSFLVERDGQELTLAMTYRRLPARFVLLFASAAAIALLFVMTGLWSLLRHPGPAARIQALLGLLVPLIFVAGPYISNGNLRQLIGAVPVIATSLIPALLLHFQLLFPRRYESIDRPFRQTLLYLPATALGILGAVVFFAFPENLGPTLSAVSLSMLVYFLVAIGVLMRNYFRASAEERRRHGLNVLVFGLLAGTLPAVVAPLLSLPGANFYVLTLVLVPFAFAYAVGKSAGPRAAGATLGYEPT